MLDLFLFFTAFTFLTLRLFSCSLLRLLFLDKLQSSAFSFLMLQPYALFFLTPLTLKFLLLGTLSFSFCSRKLLSPLTVFLVFEKLLFYLNYTVKLCRKVSCLFGRHTHICLTCTTLFTLANYDIIFIRRLLIKTPDNLWCKGLALYGFKLLRLVCPMGIGAEKHIVHCGQTIYILDIRIIRSLCSIRNVDLVACLIVAFDKLPKGKTRHKVHIFSDSVCSHNRRSDKSVAKSGTKH